jgi:hypothetical protein
VDGGWFGVDELFDLGEAAGAHLGGCVSNWFVREQMENYNSPPRLVRIAWLKCEGSGCRRRRHSWTR